MIERSRRLALCSAVGFLLVSLCSCGGESAANPTGYLTSQDGRQLTLEVLGGAGDEITSAEVVTQDQTKVVVKVKLKRGADNAPGYGIVLSATVTLSEPLGTRIVENQSGAAIPRASASSRP